MRDLVATGANDFLSFYAGARLVGTPDLYNGEVHGHRAVVVQVQRPDVEGAARQVHPAGSAGNNAHRGSEQLSDSGPPGRKSRTGQARKGIPSDTLPFTRPPYYAVMLWPLGRLPYFPAYVIWQVLNVAALAGFI